MSTEFLKVVTWEGAERWASQKWGELRNGWGKDKSDSRETREWWVKKGCVCVCVYLSLPFSLNVYLNITLALRIWIMPEHILHVFACMAFSRFLCCELWSYTRNAQVCMHALIINSHEEALVNTQDVERSILGCHVELLGRYQEGLQCSSSLFGIML